MAGRGRGKASGTLTQEQLQSLGVTSKEIQAVTSAAPPPVFPALLSKPVALESSVDRNYKILWKEDFISYLRESAYFTTKKCSKLPVQRYSDQVINVIENDPKTKRNGDFLWSCMPAELMPNFKRAKQINNSASKPKHPRTAEDIDAKLQALEQKESTAKKVEAVKKEKSETDDENEDELEEEMVDEEMDDDNDYGNNYFDNGEAYNEEDDNLDDGPVY
ncbi:DNA-directed RNA polymerase III subunit RPC7-like [Anopheles albimanus]|uniref:DNA-directed RNA polymerase III subunit n=1 Tax=Anopheles albimanus TaxID=7167 RepID=A0A182FB30_ANOAL|nr:DNA-directed RNA polymerase III subunit RPC7-like [Anopheles albimanus]XP_035784607.1 DNA-directed RNA polymerase III subunit RPC7-like [Anopheles albimanus]